MGGTLRDFWEKSGPVPLSGKLRLLLETERGVSFADASDLRMIAQSGQAGGQPVTYFRIFDPSAVVEADGDIDGYDDLKAGLVLYSGYAERDGTVRLI